MNFEKHPHARGEDPGNDVRLGAGSETPPRTWGRHKELPHNERYIGNTPTYVGKTLHAAADLGIDVKHPHVRGEDLEILLNFFLSIHQFSRKI